ncbi:MAG: YtxH domain-containing protein [Bacillota bacterium]
MRFDFWRGIIAGSLLGALFSMLVGRPVRKPKERKRPLLARIKRQRPGTRAQRFLRGVTRTVGGMIK